MAIAAATLQGAGTITVGTTLTSITNGVPYPCAHVVVQNAPDSPDDCVVGGSDAATIVLEPKDIWTMDVSDVSQVYVAAVNTNAKINFQPKVA